MCVSCQDLTCIIWVSYPPAQRFSLLVWIYTCEGGRLGPQVAYVFLDKLVGIGSVCGVLLDCVHMVSGPCVPVCTPGCVKLAWECKHTLRSDDLG